MRAFAPLTGLTFTVSATTNNASTTPARGEYKTSEAIHVYNAGTVPVFIRMGIGAQTASATTDMPVAPGAIEVFSKDSTDTIAAITASGSATLYVTPGQGA